MKLNSWTASTGVKKGVSAEMTVSWEFFSSSGSFRALSTTETMAGSHRIAPEPPLQPSYALEGFFRCRQSCRSGRFSHQNHWNGLMAVHKWCTSADLWRDVPEVDAIAAAPHKHNNQLVYGHGSLGDWHRSNRAAGGRGRAQTSSQCSIGIEWLGGNWWPPNTINTTTNHRIESRGKRRSFYCERQRKGLQTHTNSWKRGIDVVAQLCCYVSYMHNFKTKTN